jgi:hypothetical protein
VVLAFWISGVVCLGVAAVRVLLYGVAFYNLYLPLCIGFGLFGMPTGMSKQRTKLLEKRAAARETGDATVYVERPAVPDLAFMSGLFGVLALFAVPIVFGPAAVITGILAATLGHWKALIGAVLGVLGIAIWGALLYHRISL